MENRDNVNEAEEIITNVAGSGKDSGDHGKRSRRAHKTHKSGKNRAQE